MIKGLYDIWKKDFSENTDLFLRRFWADNMLFYLKQYVFLKDEIEKNIYITWVGVSATVFSLFPALYKEKKGVGSDFYFSSLSVLARSLKNVKWMHTIHEMIFGKMDSDTVMAQIIMLLIVLFDID